MSSLKFVSLVIWLLILCLGNAIKETIMFHELFDATSGDGWTFNGDYYWPSTDTECINASSCLELNDGWAEKTWSFEGFDDIRMEINVIANFDGSFGYTYWHPNGWASGSLGCSTIAEVITLDSWIWNNKASIRVRFTLNAESLDDALYMSHLKIYGTPYSTGQPTHEPTSQPTNAINNVSIDPTKAPTRYPTADPTTDPTNDPTIDPTNDPTKDPSNDPTKDPSNDPTKDPTANPAKEATINPTTDPTAAPIANPGNDSTLNPTKYPTNDPTSNPIKNTMPYNPWTTKYTSTESKNSMTTLVTTSINTVAPKTDTNSKQKQMIMLILVIIIGVVSLFTIIGCIVVIRLFCKNMKKSQQLTMTQQQKQHDVIRINSDTGNTNESHIRKDLSIGTGVEIENAFGIEMGNIYNKTGEAGIAQFEGRNKPKFNNAFSDSESNSDMYGNNDNNMLQQTPQQTAQQTPQTDQSSPRFIAGDNPTSGY